MLDPASHALVRKVLWRLIPFCICCYVLNYLDRVNISMAKLKMASVVPGFTEKVFATGAGIFFLGYFLFEVPSNLIQQRVGPRRWIARIMVSWGLISFLFIFTAGPWSFYFLRFSLGLAEAGFFPGVMLYLSHWVPQEYRARTSALFLTSTAIASVIGNPLGGGILSLAERYHPHLGSWQPESWQWLFMLEAIPTLIVGVITFFYLTDTPADARWLTPDERTRLTSLLTAEHKNHPAHHTADLRHAFTSPHTWLLSLIYGLVIFSFYTVNFYTPTIIKTALLNAGTILRESPGHPATPDVLAYLYVGLLSAIPFGAAAIGMILIGRHSDKHHERRFHFAFACLFIAAGFALAAAASTLATGSLATLLTITGLSIGAIGSFGMFGPFWAMPSQFLTGTAVAASVAIINSIGNLFGGFLGPKCIDLLSMSGGLLTGAALALLAALTVLFVPAPLPQNRTRSVSEAPALSPNNS